MLAKILEDMWVEPEVLAALSEDQKRILFLKMREEQVRRWKEREEREEREGRDNTDYKPKKGYSKRVTWLLGRDGDVSVSVIGEADEFRSSKILQSLMNNRVYADDMKGIQTERLLPEGEARQLHFKEDIQLSLTDVSDDAASPSDDTDCCSTDDDPKDPEEDSDGELDCSLDNEGDLIPLYRPHFGDHGNQLHLNAQHLSGTERAGQEDRETVCLEEERCGRGGRVAQLRKAFAGDPRSLQPANFKPLLPGKPAHSKKRSAPLIR